MVIMDYDLKLTAVKTSLLLLKLRNTDDLADKEVWTLILTNTLTKFWGEIMSLG